MAVTDEDGVQQEVQVGTPLHFDPVVHDQVGEEDHRDVTSGTQKREEAQKHAGVNRGPALASGGVPVERHAGGVGLRQEVHEGGPAAPRGGEGQRLRPVVIHHFQTPVGVKRHGVTWRRGKKQACRWWEGLLV